MADAALVTKSIRRLFLNDAFFETLCVKISSDNIDSIISKISEMKRSYDNYSLDYFPLFDWNSDTVAYERIGMYGSVVKNYLTGELLKRKNATGYYQSVFEVCLENSVYIKDDALYGSDDIRVLSEIYHDGADIFDFKSLSSYIREKELKNLLGMPVSLVAVKNEILDAAIDLSDDQDKMGVALRDYLCKCDYSRARIQEYSDQWFIKDECHGHWELWNKVAGEEKDEEKMVVINLKTPVIARNPVADVRHNAVVGIDFGTKSTIVALQDGDDQIIPLRVGMADYSVAPEMKHFENPTVMQFVDLDHFREQYAKTSGRPVTSWADLLISHEAFENLIKAENSEDIVSFTTNLKQWASGNGKSRNGGHLIIKDSKGFRCDMEPYMNLSDEDIDLIEIYAYYIGLFINNMHTGIHLDYLLSFPETFAKEIREHILTSFTRGIKKAIPSVVFEDPVCNDEFRVRQGSSEPAAYAVCALEQYGIQATDEGVFYGVFDFGGGTTDYDYGIWKNAPEDEDTYNYIIKHYGAGGDKTLGGENILELVSYYVFCDDTQNSNKKSNLDIMRENKLVFYRPEEGKLFTGTEALNNDSESALLNTKLMMEVLRPIWEERPDVCQWFGGEKKKSRIEINGLSKNSSIIFDTDDSVTAKLSLFSEDGRTEVQLNIDLSMVNSIINERIESGVRNFFEGLKQAYHKIESKKPDKVHIFLAGNSSRSRRILQFFEEYILDYNVLMFNEEVELVVDGTEIENEKKKVFNLFLNPGSNGSVVIDEFKQLNEMDKSHFVLYPPLGTDAARKIQTEHGVKFEEDDLMAPTGKTGVAFGLLMCSEGSMIKVESETKKNAQIKLNYYIGKNFRDHFKLVFDRDAEYQKWLKFSKINAETETFLLFYSELPEVVSGDILIKDNKSIHRKKCMVDHVTDDASIFIRFIGPAQLEYVVAEDDKIAQGEFLSKVYSVKL